MAFCCSCGTELIDGAGFCTQCGAKIKNTNDNRSDSFIYTNEKQCPVCGELMPEDMFYCLNCGHQFCDEDEEFNDVVYRVQMLQGTWKNKWISLVLCVFLGVFGAHKFYEGKIFFGILYLFSFGLFGVGWLVDIIRLAFKPNPYKVK